MAEFDRCRASTGQPMSHITRAHEGHSLVCPIPWIWTPRPRGIADGLTNGRHTQPFAPRLAAEAEAEPRPRAFDCTICDMYTPRRCCWPESWRTWSLRAAGSSSGVPRVLGWSAQPNSSPWPVGLWDEVTGVGWGRRRRVRRALREATATNKINSLAGGRSGLRWHMPILLAGTGHVGTIWWPRAFR